MRSGSRTGFWRMMTWWWTRNEFDEHKYFEKREIKKVIYFLIFKKSLPLSFGFFSNLFFLYLLWCISLCFLDNLLKWVETGVPGVKPPEPVIEVVENINACKRKAKISSSLFAQVSIICDLPDPRIDIHSLFVSAIHFPDLPKHRVS